MPLIIDLTNPSPSLGWANHERESFIERGPADLVMALALIHHVVISNNVPLGNFAKLLSRLGQWVILEFVPKNDPQVQKLLASRKDIFDEYTKPGFEAALNEVFRIVKAEGIPGTERLLYLLQKL